jgi:hypothetical protein
LIETLRSDKPIVETFLIGQTYSGAYPYILKSMQLVRAENKTLIINNPYAQDMIGYDAHFSSGMYNGYFKTPEQDNSVCRRQTVIAMTDSLTQFMTRGHLLSNGLVVAKDVKEVQKYAMAFHPLVANLIFQYVPKQAKGESLLLLNYPEDRIALHKYHMECSNSFKNLSTSEIDAIYKKQLSEDFITSNACKEYTSRFFSTSAVPKMLSHVAGTQLEMISGNKRPNTQETVSRLNDHFSKIKRQVANHLNMTVEQILAPLPNVPVIMAPIPHKHKEKRKRRTTTPTTTTTTMVTPPNVFEIDNNNDDNNNNNNNNDDE